MLIKRLNQEFCIQKNYPLKKKEKLRYSQIKKNWNNSSTSDLPLQVKLNEKTQGSTWVQVKKLKNTDNHKDKYKKNKCIFVTCFLSDL